MEREIISILKENIKIKEKLQDQTSIIIKIVNEIIKCYKNNKKVVLFGNGGSAADAQHIAQNVEVLGLGKGPGIDSRHRGPQIFEKRSDRHTVPLAQEFRPRDRRRRQHVRVVGRAVESVAMTAPANRWIDDFAAFRLRG